MKNEIENLLLKIKEAEQFYHKDCVLPQNAYPNHIDNSLSRYAWIRASKTWYKTAAILNIGGIIIPINIKENNGVWETEKHIENIYIGNINRDIEFKNKNLNVI